jgi:hypothetical protein
MQVRQSVALAPLYASDDGRNPDLVTDDTNSGSLVRVAMGGARDH